MRINNQIKRKVIPIIRIIEKNIIIWIPLLYIYFILISCQEVNTKIVLFLLMYFLYIIFSLSNKKLFKISQFIAYIIFLCGFILLTVFFKIEVLFILELLLIILIYIYFFLIIRYILEKIFKDDNFLLILTCLKAMMSILLFFNFINRFVRKIALFINNEFHTKFAYLISSSIKDFLLVLVVSILCIIFSLFIIQFLSRMVTLRFKKIIENKINNNSVFLLFINILVIIIFADVTFSILYFSFSTIGNSQLDLDSSVFENIRVWAPDLIQVFYYTFCLHFAIPMPTTEVIKTLDEAVKTIYYMQIIQFFHFLINKLVDITVLTYSASILLSFWKNKDNKN